MADHQVVLASGRKVGISFFGEPQARRLVVFCLPSPSAGSFDPDPVATMESGLRLICIDRPGYGSSDPLPDDVDATIELFADDIAEVMDGILAEARGVEELDFGSIGVIGWSFGAVVALALASRRPDLVDRVAVVAAPSPSRLRSGERFSPILELRKRGVERSIPSLAESLDGGPPSLAEVGVSDDDPLFESPGLHNRLSRMLEESWIQGALGVAHDRLAIRDADWMSALARVQADCLVVAGEHDPITDAKDARWYEHNIPGATTLSIAGTHLVIASEWPRILHYVGTRRNDAERG